MVKQQQKKVTKLPRYFGKWMDAGVLMQKQRLAKKSQLNVYKWSNVGWAEMIQSLQFEIMQIMH